MGGRPSLAGHSTLSGLEMTTPATVTLPPFFDVDGDAGGWGDSVTSSAVLSSRRPLKAACRSDPDSV